MTTTDFAQCVADNPPPDLQELVRAHGTYLDIPEDAWRDYFYRVGVWQGLRRDRFLR